MPSPRRLAISRSRHVGRVRGAPAATTIAVCLAAALLGCGGDRPMVEAAGPVQVHGALSFRPIRFASQAHPGRGTVVAAEEGWLAVPERHGVAGGRRIRIHFIRFPSTAARPGPPIVYLAGGPGGSGTLSAAGVRFPVFMRLREVADVIALDQRGTPFSDPRPWCPGTWDYPLDQPFTEEGLVEALRPYLARCRAALADSVDVAAYSTAESAGDLEALRQALGAPRISLWGVSYGTSLGFAYLRRHPRRVHRAVLAGIEGPDDTYKLPSNLDRAVLRVDSAVRADPRARRVVPDLAGGVRTALRRLEAHPSVSVEHPRTRARTRVTLGPDDLRRALLDWLYDRAAIERVLIRVAPVLAGEDRPLAEYALRSRIGRRESLVGLSVDCAAGLSPARAADIAREARSALMADAGNLDLRARCALWQVPELPPETRAPIRVEVPILLVSGTLDPRTPPETAVRVLATLPRGRHLVIDGAGHDDDLFSSSPRIADAMVRFLRTGEPGTARIILPPLHFDLP